MVMLMRKGATQSAAKQTPPKRAPRVGAQQRKARHWQQGRVFVTILEVAGHWRSWLARFHGMEEVIGSNPICSTILLTLKPLNGEGFLFGILVMMDRSLNALSSEF